MPRFFDPFGTLRLGSLAFQQDAGAGATANPNPPNPPPAPDPNPGNPPPSEEQQPNANDDASEGEETDQTKGKQKASKVYSEREFRNAVSRELSSREANLRDSIRAELASEQELAAAKSSGELSKVIEAQDKKLRDLEPLRTEVEEFRRLAEARYSAAFDGLPDSIKLFAPDDQASVLEKERWLVEKALPATKSLGALKPVDGLSGDTDPPKRQKKREDDLVAIRDGFAQTGDYRAL